MSTPIAYTNLLHFTVIPQDNPLFMLLLDLSLYSESLPPTPVYDVIAPGYSTPVRVSAVPRSITNINSGVLFGSLTADLTDFAELPDGAYTITYKVQPYETFHTTIYELRTVVTERALDAVYMTVENNCRDARYKQWHSDLLDVSVMLATARALVRLGHLDRGTTVFKEVQVEVARLGKVTLKLTV